MSFTKNMGRNLTNKYGEKLLNSAKKSTTDAIKIASNRTIQNTAEKTGDLIGNKIQDKIISISKTSSKELHSQNENEIEIRKKDISPEKRQQIIDEVRLV